MQMCTRRGLWLPVLVCVLAMSCKPQPTEAPAPKAQPVDVSSGTVLERLFPLQDQHVYQYLTESDAGEGMLMARVTRIDAAHGNLQMSGNTKSFEYVADGVVLQRKGAAPVYVLKTPLAVGTSWRGEHGGVVKIITVNAIIEVPAGRYTGCAQTLEERGGDRPLRVATTFCPGAGIVLLEAASGAHMERAALKSYGPPVEIGPDGVSVSK